jgi:predicted O-methyltransferase YrrM
MLQRHVADKRRAVEIGVYEGMTTRALGDAMVVPGAELYAIDPFEAGRLGINWNQLVAHREVRSISSKAKVIFIRRRSYEAAMILSGVFDFVFLDGDHSFEGIARDWRDWSGRLSPGGIFALHDTRVPDHDGSVAALGSFRYFEETIRHDPGYRLIDQVDSLSILQRVT